jgi:tryptophan synthase beta chain
VRLHPLSGAPVSDPTMPIALTPPRLQDFREGLEKLLRAKLQQNPGQPDVRLRLLDLYFESRRDQDFLRLAREHHRTLLDASTSREWQRVASMGRMLLPGESLFAPRHADRIEFIGTVDIPAPRPKHRRFGDEERYQGLFAELGARYEEVRRDSRFLAELEMLLMGLATRRPTPLIHARQLSEHVGGAQIYIKREDLAGDHPHLTVAIAGQALLARRLGRSTIVTGTVDGRRGVIVATMAARMRLNAIVYMDTQQAERAASQVTLMKLLGAEVRCVRAANCRNRDVREAALAHWAGDPEHSLLVPGLDAAPQPYPVMTSELTSVIGRECRRQASARGLPDLVVTRGSTTSDALGLFPAFLSDPTVRLACVEVEPEPEVDPRDAPDPFNQTGMPLSHSERKVATAILDRLEYPSVAREHALLRASGRVEYVQVARAAARQAMMDMARLEGVVAPVQTARALAFACEQARAMKPNQTVLVVMAEASDKGMWDIQRLLETR